MKNYNENYIEIQERNGSLLYNSIYYIPLIKIISPCGINISGIGHLFDVNNPKNKYNIFHFYTFNMVPIQFNIRSKPILKCFLTEYFTILCTY